MGDYHVICDICGFKRWRSKARKNWKGQIVCRRCYEPRHPSETARMRVEKVGVPDPRPRPTDVFLDPGDVTVDSL